MTRLTNRRRSRTSTEEGAKPAAVRAPFISRKLETFSVLSGEGLELIERNADTILKETGMEFHGDPEILDIFRNAGCDVEGTRVRFEPGFCRRTIQATAPRQFTQLRRRGGK